jgi:hypothetical protein
VLVARHPLSVHRGDYVAFGLLSAEDFEVTVGTVVPLVVERCGMESLGGTALSDFLFCGDARDWRGVYGRGLRCVRELGYRSGRVSFCVA